MAPSKMLLLQKCYVIIIVLITEATLMCLVKPWINRRKEKGAYSLSNTGSLPRRSAKLQEFLKKIFSNIV